MHGIVNLLLNKIKPIKEFDLSKAQYENLEALALSYIYVVLIILFQFDTNSVNKKDLDDDKNFQFNKWIEVIQNHLDNVKKDTFGW